jgi:CheY-like chemotaxis protein
MKGDITIKHSVIGKGTCIRFFFPIQVASSNSTIIHKYKNKNILLIDSIKERRLDLLQQLCHCQTKPFSCQTMEESESIINIIQFELALIDQNIVIPTSFSIPYILIKDEQPHPIDVLKYLTNQYQAKRNYPNQTHTHTHTHTHTQNASDKPDWTQMKILVVEDNIHNLFVITEMLKKLGFNIIDSAKTGPEAIQKSVGQLYDVILMDLLIPSIDGISAGLQILNYYKSKKNAVQHQNHYRNSILNIPTIIAVTAMLTEETQKKCINAGFQAFLSKPLLQDELETMLQIIAKKNFKKL